ncbi:DUF6268 family outer membrane beta-barrel protein [Phocaeicola sp.]|uniref:DUF6268 family outer membrane beta-barrel protein n=1 Tax=Phocaeicola sp. TaxID=2773926 RepID=UPI0023CCBB28|nr:DUF6268 family outer membrane beta-barrel protein [Phocaeicola sp.]MDE5677563.1 hypothetical protein [Phocaeicola sp.]
MGNRILMIAILINLSLRCFGQGYMNYDYLFSSSFKDQEGNKHGSGNLQKISGRYTIPVSKRLNERNQPTAWGMLLSTSYGIMDNVGEAQALNPDRILNVGLTASHLRPLSERWSLLASLGCGIYASPDEVRWQSLLVNGAFIFAYRLHENLSIGVGGGVTNSYGVPIIIPMLYLTWRTNWRYKVSIDMVDALKVQVATQIASKIQLELNALEMDGMAAVMRMDGKDKIYSSAMITSDLIASYRVFGKASFYAGIGGVWMRSSFITDRTLKSFFKTLSERKNMDEYIFAPSFRASVGFRYGF